MPTAKLTPPVRAKVIALLAKGADLASAAKAVKVSRKGLYLAAKNDPAFAQAIQEGKDVADDAVVSALWTKAVKGKNVIAMIFWLKNRRPTEWRDKRELEHSGGLTLAQLVAAAEAEDEAAAKKAA